MSPARRLLRSAPAGLVFVLALAHCSSKPSTGGTGGGGGHQEKVGSPCVPSEETDPRFQGFRVTEESIETGAPECGGGVCLVNHFQGRVTCPQGQTPASVEACNPASPSPCTDPSAKCVEAERLAPACSCVPTKAGDCADACSGISGTACDPVVKTCTCISDQAINGTAYFCAPSVDGCVGQTCVRVLKSFACHKPGNCQSPNAMDNGGGKQCCFPGTDTPVSAEVCGQCDASSHRNADDAVYCSCRCGRPDGAPADPTDTFCDCPTGFECSEIRKDFGIGDTHLAGKYCIKAGTAYGGNAVTCGQVSGNADPSLCYGVGSAGP